MKSLFCSLKFALLSAVAAIAFAGTATAQTATCVSGCQPPPLPIAPPMGLTVQGWVQSGAVGIGQTNGVGQHVTGEVVTVTDELFTLGADTFLTGNANPDCTVNCSDSQSKLSITGFSKVGAASVGYASFDGSSCATGNCPLGASSVSQTGTNGMFKASLFQNWQGTPMPVVAPTVQ